MNLYFNAHVSLEQGWTSMAEIIITIILNNNVILIIKHDYSLIGKHVLTEPLKHNVVKLIMQYN